MNTVLKQQVLRIATLALLFAILGCGGSGNTHEIGSPKTQPPAPEALQKGPSIPAIPKKSNAEAAPVE